MNGRAWTEHELAVLRREYPKCGARPIAQMIDRTVSSITGKARDLSLSCDSQWTDEDVAKLREMYSKARPGELAIAFKRSRKSITAKARRLGLMNKCFWTAQQLKYLRDSYGRVPTSQLIDRLGRNRLTVAKKASDLGLTCPKRQDLESIKAISRRTKIHRQVVALCLSAAGYRYESTTVARQMFTRAEANEAIRKYGETFKREHLARLRTRKRKVAA